ncbi:MAG: RHS repeat-associated core domain-containing protein, partial [Nanoarchaeota archaeon]
MKIKILILFFIFILISLPFISALPFGTEVTTIQSSTEQIHNSTYIYGPDGKILARIDENNKTYFYHTDVIGSVVSITTNNTNQSITNPFQFSGKEWDGDTRLYYFGRRYYDPSIGRFITVDPILGDTNSYSYAENNPLTNVDPTGEYSSVKRAPPARCQPEIPIGTSYTGDEVCQMPEWFLTLLYLRNVLEEHGHKEHTRIVAETTALAVPVEKVVSPLAKVPIVKNICTKVMYYLGKCGEFLRGEGGFARLPGGGSGKIKEAERLIEDYLGKDAV